MLISELGSIESCKINSGDGENFAPNIVNVSFMGLRSETLLHALEAEGVYVSTGSACSSNHPELSHVLLAMGHDKKRIDAAIRLSKSLCTSEHEVKKAITLTILVKVTFKDLP